MNISIKTKLSLSYVILSLLLAGAILVLTNYFLEREFQQYITRNQEIMNRSLVETINSEIRETGKFPTIEELNRIGDDALAKGLVLMVDDQNQNQLFCTSTLSSASMMETMKERMAGVHSNFEGEYTEKTYDLVIDNLPRGSVTIGYYGPFYYSDADIQFLQVLNNIYIGVAIVFSIVAVLLGLFMANRISKPIKKVIEQTKKIESGNYAERVLADSKTKEINQLLVSVNHLAESMENQLLSKKRMTRDYAHEFRTPLAMLQLDLEAMIDGIYEPTKERLESCHREILRLNRMLMDLDKLIKVEEGVVLEKSIFDLSEVILDASLAFHLSAEAKHIRLEQQIEPCLIHGDRDKMIQVLVNLLTNALKYTDPGGSITITLKKHPKQVELIVSDTGIGISEEDLPNVFEHLYRTDKSRNRDTGGSGIGLSIVKAIVEAHGGSIEVKSKLNQGSTFRIFFPQ